MVGTEFQPLNLGVFADGLFVVEPVANLEQIDQGDARKVCVTTASPVTTEYKKTYKRVTLVTLKSGNFF